MKLSGWAHLLEGWGLMMEDCNIKTCVPLRKNNNMGNSDTVTEHIAITRQSNTQHFVMEDCNIKTCHWGRWNIMGIFDTVTWYSIKEMFKVWNMLYGIWNMSSQCKTHLHILLFWMMKWEYCTTRKGNAVSSNVILNMEHGGLSNRTFLGIMKH